LLDWLVTGLADDLGGRAAGPSDVEHLKRARESLSVLDERLDEGLAKSYPGVRLLRDALSALEEGVQSAEVPAPVVEETPAAPGPETAAPQAPASEAFPPPIDGPE